MYRKEIIYMGLYKEGNRMGSAGFLKVENRGQESRLYLKVQNIPLGISGRFPIRVHNGSGWKEMNGIAVQDGAGSWEENLLEEVEGVMVQIMLPGGYSLEGTSRTALEAGQGSAESRELTSRERERKSAEDGQRRETDERTGDRQWLTEDERRVDREKLAEDERGVDNKRLTESERGTAGQNFSEDERKIDDQNLIEERTTAAHRSAQNPQPNEEQRKQTNTPTRRERPRVPETILIKEELPRRTAETNTVMPQEITTYNLKEDKWEQILDNYENIHPYGDERVYVKLEPKDFVILQSPYQHLVNNSFLLHGFYNYRYIILGREQDYYLGVPGVFYEREKMVALMFGFEAFECPGGNVKAGEFGYYLRKVEL